MSLDRLWLESLQKASTAHFLAIDLGVPWETEREETGDKISLSFLSGHVKKLSEEEHLATFKLRLVCTVSTEGLYDLSDLSGSAATTLLLPIQDGTVCASPLLDEIDISLFDFKHGYQQSLMEQSYSARLRG